MSPSSSSSSSSSLWTVGVVAAAAVAAAAASAASFVAGYHFAAFASKKKAMLKDKDEEDGESKTTTTTTTSKSTSKSQQLLLLLQQQQRQQQQSQSHTHTHTHTHTDTELPEELRLEQLSRHELFFSSSSSTSTSSSTGSSSGMSKIRSAKVCVVGLGGVGSHTAVMLARGGVATWTSSSWTTSSSSTSSSSTSSTSTSQIQNHGHGGLIRLIDFDQVSLSSLNRHACATMDDVGTSKVHCLWRYLTCGGLKLNSSNVQPIQEMFTKHNASRLLKIIDDDDDTIGGNNNNNNSNDVDNDSNNNDDDNYNYYDWDVVIDCIDDVPTKASLIEFCLKRKIKVVSCMGAGGKCDFTKLHYSDLRTASRDPLASKLRQTLKRNMKKKNMKMKKKQNKNKNDNDDDNNDYDDGDDDGWLDDMDRLSVVYSSEQPVVKLADLTEEQQNHKLLQNKATTTSNAHSSVSNEFGQVDGMRVRVLPVLGPIPAIMGQALASLTLCHLADQPIQNPQTGERVGKNVRNRLFQKLLDRELKITSGKIQVVLDEEEDDGNLYTGRLEIDGDDIEYLYGIWRNRCAVTGARIGTALFLARWNLSKPATTDNLILVCQQALMDMDTKGKVASLPLKTRQKINQRLHSCRDMIE